MEVYFPCALVLTPSLAYNQRGPGSTVVSGSHRSVDVGDADILLADTEAINQLLSGYSVRSHPRRDLLLCMARVTFDLPQELSAVLSAGGGDLSRAVMESLALEAYRDANFRRRSFAACWDSRAIMNWTPS